MSQVPIKILNEGYTIFFKSNSYLGLHGTYIKHFKDGIYPYNLPQEELLHIRILPHVMEALNNGFIIQLNKPNYMIMALLGIEKTEQDSKEKYLELHNEYKGVDLSTILINMETDLSHQSKDDTTDVKEYKKLYKGESKYE